MRRSKDRKDDEPQARPPAADRDVVSEASERLATIVNAAERAAEQVIDDAEAKAREILAGAEADAERIRSEAIAAVERARRELGSLTSEADPAPPPASRGNHLKPVPASEPATEPGAAAPQSSEPDAGSPRSLAEAGEPVVPGGSKRGTPAGARLLATQMAVSGSSREEIEARLRNGFEIEDTTAILDAILGPEE